MVSINRGDVVLADFGEPRGSSPAYVRPAVVLQSDPYNHSRINTIVLVVVTFSTALARFPDNVFLPEGTAGLDRGSVVNVTQLMTVDRSYVIQTLGHLPSRFMQLVDDGARRLLGF